MDTIEILQSVEPSTDASCSNADARDFSDASDAPEPFMGLEESDQALFDGIFQHDYQSDGLGNALYGNASCYGAGLEHSAENTADSPAETERVKQERIPEVAGVRLTRRGQVFFVPVEKETIRIGTKVLVELEQGIALTEVVSIFYKDQGVHRESFPLDGNIIGLATAKDIAAHAENKLLADEAEAFCKTCIRQRSLDMKQVDVAVLHDRSKIIFFFTAPSRIDFRELVKDLVRCYRTRIELRQIGVRHETQMLGGIGNCGRVCCCHNYLRKFAPVTIKMAKEQNLFLNPAKLSGLCGRLLCCLSFEQANYEEFNRRCPRLGKRYATDAGMVRIVRTNLFSQTIIVQADGEDEKEYSLEAWEALHPQRQEKFDRLDRTDRNEFPVAYEELQGDGHGEDHRERRSKKNTHQPLLNHLTNDGEVVSEEALAALETLEQGPAPNQALGRHHDSGKEEGQHQRPRQNRPPHKNFAPNNNRPKRKRSTQ